MRNGVALSLLFALCSAAATAAPATAALTFVSLDGAHVNDGLLHVGVITYAQHGSRRVSRITRRVGVRIEGAAGGRATLRASLESPDTRCRIRIDGLELSAMPRVIEMAAEIGATLAHRIEIEVPVEAAEGTLLSAIVWEVTKN
jgi:hypothetical protein